MIRRAFLLLTVSSFPLFSLPAKLHAAESSGGGTRQWVLVVAPGLREALRPLEEKRKAEGWAVTVLPAEAGLEANRKRLAELAAKPGPLCVVLAGDFAASMTRTAGSEGATIGAPPGRGTQLRMKNLPSDAPWNVIDGRPERIVETGRLPARDAREAAVMVSKILAWPGIAAESGPFPEAALVAGHHGAPAAFAGMADSMINNLAQRLVTRLPASFRLDAAVHVDGSPWQVSGDDLKTAAADMLAASPTLLAYMGHSSPETPVSKNLALLGRNDWQALKNGPPRVGLFFSCGCHTTELDPGAESFGFAAMRAPGGVAAVIGSHGISYAAFGYLGMCGLLNGLNAEPAPTRLGQLWAATREGLAREPISSTEFAMLDMTDGTGGQVPLEAQRLEHLEMWMLLGDPAMPLLPPAPGMRLSVAGDAMAGGTLQVKGVLPPTKSSGAPAPAAGKSQGALRITLERAPGTPRGDLPEVPDKGAERQSAARERRKLSGEVTLVSSAAVWKGNQWEAVLKLPDPLPAKPWILRAGPESGPGAAGLLLIP